MKNAFTEPKEKKISVRKPKRVKLPKSAIKPVPMPKATTKTAAAGTSRRKKSPFGF
jgi:hypothetical protein